MIFPEDEPLKSLQFAYTTWNTTWRTCIVLEGSRRLGNPCVAQRGITHETCKLNFIPYFYDTTRTSIWYAVNLDMAMIN